MNTCVLRADLKESKVGAFRKFEGREFQRVGAATLKALSPKVRRKVRGTDSSPESDERKVREGVGRWRRSERY